MRRRSRPLGDATEEIDEGAVCLTRVGVGETRDGVSEVRALEGRVLVDRAGEEALAERTERDEANTKFLERRKDLLLRLAPPERVLALERRHRLDRVGSTYVLNACL